MAGKRKSKRSWAQEKLVKEAIAAAVPVILKSIGTRLTERHPDRWVPVTKLIKLDRGLSNSVWKHGRSIETQGTTLHSSLTANHHLMRHKFDVDWIILGRPRRRSEAEPRTEAARQNRAIPFQRPVDASKLSGFDETKRLVKQDIQNVLDAIATAKAATDESSDTASASAASAASATSASASAETTPIRRTRGAERVASSVKKILEAGTLADVKDAYDEVPSEQKPTVLFEVTQLAKKAEDYSSKLAQMTDSTSAHDVLNMFDSDLICNRYFLEKLVGSKGYEDSISPRVAFSELNDRTKKDVSNLLGAIALRVMQILLPRDSGDGYGEIIKAVMDSKPFRLHAMPDVTCDYRGYEEWKRSPMVKAVKSTFDKLGRGDKQTRVQLLSIFVGYYPIYWLKDAFNVGDTLIGQAKDHASDNDRGPGNSDPFFLKDTRNKRAGGKEIGFQEWLKDPSNIKTSPEIRKDGSGNYIEKEVRYKALRTGPAYVQYQANLEREKKPFYSRRHFYQRVKEEQLRDTTKDNGLCPSCTKYGEQTWDMLRSVVKLVHGPGAERNSAIEEINKYETYFKRGGKFYNSLERESDCIHHCTVYALSDPLDDDFYQRCDHDHPIGDEAVEACDKLFRSLRQDAVTFLSAKSFTVHDNEGNDWEATGVRGGKVILARDGEDRKMPWSEAVKKGLILSDVDCLAIPATIDRLQQNHLNLRRHLYLDRNQMFGEMEVNAQEKCRIESDYCMKMRAAIWRAGSQDFHLLMNKGTSVHTSALSITLSDDDAAAMTAIEMEVEAGDEKVIHVDSFGSNTGQGGYETLCVLEATLKKAKELQPALENAVLIQDAGSGYKSTTVVAGLRKSREMTGVRVKRLIFNASGEGKRHKTDGHFTAIKAKRRSAMMAGQPAECTTPRREVLAQRYQGGIDGAHPFLLEFHYDNEVAVAAIPSISQYHAFEYLDDGGIRMWKTHGVGDGKVMSREEIDKLYADAAKKAASKKSKTTEGSGNDDASSEEEEEEAENSDDEVEEDWFRFAMQYRFARVAKLCTRGSGRIYLGTAIKGGYDEDDNRCVLVEFDEPDAVQYEDDDEPDSNLENIRLDGELQRMLRLYKKEGVDLDHTKPSGRDDDDDDDADFNSARGPRSSSRATSSAAKPQARKRSSQSQPRRQQRSSADDEPVVVQESTGATLATVEQSSIANEKVVCRVVPSYRKKREKAKAVAERKRKREEEMPAKQRKKICQDRKVKKIESVVRPMEEAATYPLAEGYTRSFHSLMMGHGLKRTRDSNEVDPVAEEILEELFQCGVAKESNRKGVLEMEEQCGRDMPSLLVPPRSAIAAWLQIRVSSAKCAKEKCKGDKKRRHSPKEAMQQRAAVVKMEEKRKISTDDERSKDLWLAKYKGVLLEFSSDGSNGSEAVEGEIRIIVSVRFNNDAKQWEVETDHASEVEDLAAHVHVGAAAAETDDIIYIPIGSRKSKGEIGPFIKAYNERLFAADSD